MEQNKRLEGNRETKSTLPIVLLVAVFLSLMFSMGVVLGWSSNQFNNSLTSEDLKFTGNQNITRYLSIPNSVFLLRNVTLNLSGLPAWNFFYKFNSNHNEETDRMNLTRLSGTANFLTGKLGTALNMTSTELTNSSTIASEFNFRTNDFTIAFWFNVNDTTPSYILAHANAILEAGCWVIGHSIENPYEIEWLMTNTFMSNLTQNTWNRIVITRKANNLTMWLNGTAITSATDTTDYNGNYNFRIGWNHASDNSPVGLLDDLMISNSTAWSYSDILIDWNNGNGGEKSFSLVSNLSLKIVNTNILNYSGSFNQPNNKTTNFASIINQYLNSTYLIGSNYLIPFIFHSDTVGILRYLDLIFNNFEFLENSQNYSSSTYETLTELFSINLTSDNSYSSLAYLIYNGTSYLGTKTGSGNNLIFSKTLDMNSPYGNKSFYWIIGLTNSSGTTNYTSSWHNQTVNPILLGLCNSTLKVPYINFTFKDETTDLNMNATMDLATWTYTLGTTTKSLIISNTSTNPSYAFCFSPADKTISETVTFQYANTGYPQRQYYRSGSLTNSTTNQVLYLLGSGSGIYSTFVTNSIANTPITGVTVQVERQFAGLWVLMSQGTTDSSGAVTFWVNPNYDHKITATKTGYSSTTVTIRPTQSQYTLQMSGGGDTNATYSSMLEGITYETYPKSGYLRNNTDYTFWFNINASLGNLIKYKMEITNSNFTVLSYVEGTNPHGSNISLTLNTVTNDTLYGRYYIDTGTGYFLLDPNLWTITEEIDTSGSIWNAIKNTISYRGSNEDTYSQLWWIFFLLFVGLASLCYFTGAELSNPGIVLIFVVIFLGIFSYMGYFNINFIDLDQCTAYGTFSLCSTFQNWAIFIVSALFTVGYMFRRWAE